MVNGCFPLFVWVREELLTIPPTHQRPFEDDFRAEISRGMPAKMYGNLVPFLNDIRDSFSVTCC